MKPKSHNIEATPLYLFEKCWKTIILFYFGLVGNFCVWSWQILNYRFCFDEWLVTNRLINSSFSGRFVTLLGREFGLPWNESALSNKFHCSLHERIPVMLGSYNIACVDLYGWEGHTGIYSNLRSGPYSLRVITSKNYIALTKVSYKSLYDPGNNVVMCNHHVIYQKLNLHLKSVPSTLNWKYQFYSKFLYGSGKSKQVHIGFMALQWSNIGQ